MSFLRQLWTQTETEPCVRHYLVTMFPRQPAKVDVTGADRNLSCTNYVPTLVTGPTVDSYTPDFFFFRVFE